MLLTILYYDTLYCTILLDYERSNYMIKVGLAPNPDKCSKCEKKDCPRYEGSEQQVEKLGEVVEGSDA